LPLKTNKKRPLAKLQKMNTTQNKAETHHKAEKVDFLRHLSDHGLNLNFTCPKKTALVNALKTEGIHVVKAGRSRVTLTRIGKVTFTDAFFSVGSNHVNNAHYLDGSLIFKCDDNQARLVLRSIILGENLPSMVTPRDGASQDGLRSWLAKNAWALLGEAGLRSKAIESVKSRFDSTLKTWNYRVSELEKDVGRHEARNYVNELTQAKQSFKFTLQNIERNKAENEGVYKEIDQALKDLATLERKEGPTDSGALSVGWRVGFSYDYDSKNGKKNYYFEGTRDIRSHEFVRPNYVAKIEGDTLSLSSGIEVPFNASQVLAWLRGEQPAPQTRYGTCQIVKTCAQDGTTPLNLVKCGCHVIDAAKDLGEPFATLLAPTHSVTLVKGLPRVNYSENPQGFEERCNAWKEKDKEKLTQRHAFAVTDYVSTCKKIRKAREEHSQTLETILTDLEKAKLDRLKAKQDLDDIEGVHLGIGLEKAILFGKALASALVSTKA